MNRHRQTSPFQPGMPQTGETATALREQAPQAFSPAVMEVAQTWSPLINRRKQRRGAPCGSQACAQIHRIGAASAPPLALPLPVAVHDVSENGLCILVDETLHLHNRIEPGDFLEIRYTNAERQPNTLSLYAEVRHITRCGGNGSAERFMVGMYLLQKF